MRLAKGGGLHIDEYYSHGLIQYDNAFIIYDEDFYNQWHDKEYFKKYVTVKSDEVWDLSKAYTNQILDVHPPLYYLLLRIAASFQLDDFSVWPGSILNMILFVFSTIVLYKIGNKIFKNKWYSIILCLMNGFCIGTIETVMFIRMYQLMVLNVLLLLDWHLCKKDKKLEKKDLIQLGILVITGFLTHYYYAIMVAIFYFIYMFSAKKNQKEDMIKYTATMIIAVLMAILIFPYCIQHIFWGYRGEQSFGNLINFELYGLRIKRYAQIINTHILLEQYIFFGIIMGLAILTMVSRKRKKQELEGQREIGYVFFPSILYTMLIVIISVYSDFRYITPIIPFFMILFVYGLKLVLEEILNKKAVYVATILVILYCNYNLPRIGDNLYTAKDNKQYINDFLEEGIHTCLLVDDLLDIGNSSIMTLYDFYLALDETYIIAPKDVTSQKMKEIFENKPIQEGSILITTKENVNKVVGELLKSDLFSDAKVVLISARYYIIKLK